jgi:ATP-dependent Lhr-like helicase
MLTSRARDVLRTVRWVIVDEIHAVAGTKRGSHLALSLERLETLCAEPGGRAFQRIGLSATQRPVEEIGRFLVGPARDVRIVDASEPKRLDLEVLVPVEDMANPSAGDEAAIATAESRSSVWPAIYPRLLDLVRAHRSTIIFTNSRRLSERIAQRLNEMDREEEPAVAIAPGWGLVGGDGVHARAPSMEPGDNRSEGNGAGRRPTAQTDLVKAHHGSVSREQRREIEEALKAGTLRGIVATSSLELGIDMGAVDLVIQVESPKSVARGLQRIGRAGHTVDAVSRGKFFPKYRGDLLETAVVVERMKAGEIESTRVPKNPLDVLAQQIVAACALDARSPDELFDMARRTYSFGDLSRDLFESTLDLLSGRYPSDEFAELRPRVVWDRSANTVTARGDARRIAITSGGTIPDRGLYGVYLGEDGPRIGELDEEMVYESRPGETFLLGATTWRIEQITPNRVVVSPAPGEPGKMPFWKGDGVGRPLELGQALGRFTREVVSRPEDAAVALLAERSNLDPLAARNLVGYLREQREATRSVPDDRTVVIERFRDELGDWRLCLLTPFGGRVHAPWATAIEAKLQAQRGYAVQAIWSDDGIAVRFPDADEPPPAELLLVEPEEVEELVTGTLASTSLFASHFRENAARALLLPRRFAGQRRPLWQMRQRAADLLAVASRYGSFPIILETYRECLQDVFDMPGLVGVLRDISARRIQVVSVETEAASPFASSLIFDYIAEFMYEGDAPLAERRAQALTLDRELLEELLGQEELRELLDPAALAELELELQHLAGRKARNADQLHDLLRRVGDLSPGEIEARSLVPVPPGDARFQHVRIAGEERFVAVEDVARYRDALGVVPPAGVPGVYLGRTEDALGSLLVRFARTHVPFVAADPARRWGLSERGVRDELQRLVRAGTLLYGEFRPGGLEREWCDPEVLRSLRRRSLARLRKAVEPVSKEAFARFLPGWQGVGRTRPLFDVLVQLEGAPIPASILEAEVLPARVAEYRPRDIDELCSAGEILWVGRGSLGRDDGKVAVYRRDRLALLPSPGEPPSGDIPARILGYLRARGASFYRELHAAAGGGPDEPVLDALWQLVWAGYVTNDTFEPLRALRYRRSRKTTRRRPTLTRLGPPEAAGRWSLVPSLDGGAGSNERALATAQALLERYGVVTREVSVAEGVPGGFSGIYPVLRLMEESGKIRRGYFVEGLGGAQFAVAGAVDRLRAERERPDAARGFRLAATDPANPYGVALPWNGRRAAGNTVVLVDGELALYLDHGGDALTILPACDDPEVAAAAFEALGSASVSRVNGEPALHSPFIGLLTNAGFKRDYLSLTRAPVAGAARAGG